MWLNCSEYVLESAPSAGMWIQRDLLIEVATPIWLGRDYDADNDRGKRTRSMWAALNGKQERSRVWIASVLEIKGPQPFFDRTSGVAFGPAGFAWRLPSLSPSLTCNLCIACCRPERDEGPVHLAPRVTHIPLPPLVACPLPRGHGPQHRHNLRRGLHWVWLFLRVRPPVWHIISSYRCSAGCWVPSAVKCTSISGDTLWIARSTRLW